MSRRLLLALLALAGAVLVAGTPGAAAPTARHAVAGASDCLGHSSARVPEWAPNLHEPADISAAQSALLAQRLEPGLAAAERDSSRGTCTRVW